MKYIISVITTCTVAVLLMLILFTPPKCEHEGKGEIFSFQSPGSTALGYVKPYCENCNHYFGYTLFQETPDDFSYLEVIREHSDGEDIVGGEYYTMTAIVTLGDYDSMKTRVRCKVRNENIIVEFSVEFREEFEDAVALLESGDEITFRGKFYDTGCGWTDCELIG